MLLGLITAGLLFAAPPPRPAPPTRLAPPTRPAPTLAELDTRRFELHLGARAGFRGLGGPSFGGGLSIGLGVRLWRGLYLEAGVGESVYQPHGAPDPADATADGSTETFRHFGSHVPRAALPPAAPADAPTAEADPSPLLVGQILLGVRYEVRTPATMLVRPSVFVGATHLHEATLDDFARAPGKTLAGTGEFIRHRTGLQVGLGMRVPFPERWGPVAPRFSARIDGDFAYYFDAHPGRVQAGLGAGLQVVF